MRNASTILGVHIMPAEKDNLSEQLHYMDSMLKRVFPRLKPFPKNEYLGLATIYEDYTIQAKWCAEKFLDYQRIQLLDFLIDLGFHNALLSRRELSLIYDIGRILNLPDAEIKSMLNIRYLHFEKSKENNRRTKNSIGFNKNSL